MLSWYSSLVVLPWCSHSIVSIFLSNTSNTYIQSKVIHLNRTIWKQCKILLLWCTRSVWAGVHFPSSPLLWELEGCYSSAVFWLQLSSAGTAAALSLQHSYLPGVGWGWARYCPGIHTQASWPELTEGTFHTMWHQLRYKRWEKEEEGGSLIFYSVPKPSQAIASVPGKCCFPGSGWTSPADGK